MSNYITAQNMDKKKLIMYTKKKKPLLAEQQRNPKHKRQKEENYAKNQADKSCEKSNFVPNT